MTLSDDSIPSYTFEEILAKDGKLVYRTKGSSMKPMLKENRDLVIIQIPESRLKKHDVALYKRGNSYVLHRVIDVKSDHYLIRGDNTYSLESIPDKAVIGVLKSFQRNGHRHDVSEIGYQIYTHFWQAIYPLRFFCFKIRHFLYLFVLGSSTGAPESTISDGISDISEDSSDIS